MKKIFILVPTCICMHTLLPAQEWHTTGNSGTNTSTNFIGTKDNVAFKVRTNNTTRMYITAGGKIGIGTTSPQANLDVAGTILGFDSYFGKRFPTSVGTSGASYSSVGYGLTFTDTTANYRYRLNDFSSMISFRSGGFDFNTAPFGTAGNVIHYTPVMAILQNGNVGIGTNNPAYKFSVSGAPGFGPVASIENTHEFGSGLYMMAGSNVGGGAALIHFLRPDGITIGIIKQATASSVSYSTTSDKRLKNIIGTSQKGLPDLMRIKIYDYTFKSDPNKKVLTGFMAQELYDIFPQSVSKPGDSNKPAEKDPWMVDYGSITPLIIKSVQEQQQLIDELKRSDDELKKENENLKERILKLEAALQSLTTNNGNAPGAIANASLEQNNPNPFTKITTIYYSIPRGSKGQINIYDHAGKLVKILNANAAGQLQVNGHDLATGVYTYTLMVDGKVASSKQMLMIK